MWLGVVQACHTLLSLSIITGQAPSHHVRVQTLHKPNYSMCTKVRSQLVLQNVQSTFPICTTKMGQKHHQYEIP